MLAPAGVCLQSVARASFVCVLVVVSGVGAVQYKLAGYGRSWFCSCVGCGVGCGVGCRVGCWCIGVLDCKVWQELVLALCGL